MSDCDESTVYAPPLREQASPALESARAAHELSPEAVAARFRWARAAGHPSWLWPDVSMADWRRALNELQRVAHALLIGDRPVIMSNVPEAGAVTVAAYTSGLGPWLGWQCEQGRLSAAPAVERVLAEHLAQGRRRTAAVQQTLDGTLAVAAAAGARCVVLKGSHTARAYFAEVALRPVADIDVCFDARAIAAVEAGLRRAGFAEQRAARHVRPYRSEWQAPHGGRVLRSLTLTHAEDPIAVDVHGTMDIDFYGVRTVRFDDAAQALCEQAAWLPAHAAVLKQPLLAAHHAVHASHGMHGLTLLRLVELCLMVRHDMRTAADWRALGELLRELDAERFAYPAFALADKLAVGTIERAFLERLAAASPPRLRSVVNELTPAGAQRMQGLVLSERFMFARGALEHVKRAAFMLVPTGVTGSLPRLADIYAKRAYRLLRGSVSWQ